MKGEDIRRLRDKLGLTQEELARLLGVGFATVNRWENNKAQPRGQALQILEKLMEIVEEAERNGEEELEDIKKIMKEVESGKLVMNFSSYLPRSVLGLLAAGGIVGFIAGLSTALLLNKLKGNKDDDK